MSLQQQEGPSPSQLAFDLHPFLSSVEEIAAHHGLSHDSGVSFGSSTSTLKSPRSNNGPKAMSESSSSSSLKRVSVITEEAKRERKVMASPDTTAAFDAREEVWSDVARKVKPFGDTLRHERLRTTLGETTLSSNCVSILEYSNKEELECSAVHDAQVELLRTLANLCIDHDANRTEVLRHKGPQAIIALIHSVLASQQEKFPISILNLLRTAAGALLNTQLDHPDTRLALREDEVAIATLLQLATDARIYSVGDWYTRTEASGMEGKQRLSTGASLVAWSWRIIQDVCANESKDQADSSMEDKSEEGDKTIESIVAVGPAKAFECLIKPLLPFVSRQPVSTVKGAWDADDVSDLMESDMDIVQIATELLEACALDSMHFRLTALTAFVGQGGYKSSLDFLMQFLDLAKPPRAWQADREEGESGCLPPEPSDADSARELHDHFERAKAAVAKAVVIIAGEDENMSVLFEAKENWFMNTLKDWMARDVKERDDLVSTAMLAMGNLARKDSHCLALVHQHGLVPSLTALLTPSADIKVTHGIICLLKNLSIPADNKLVIGRKYKTIGLLPPYLGQEMDKVQPLQFATVGLLKHLCAGCAENAVDAVCVGDTLEVLLELIQRTEDVPTRMESTRVLVNVAKTLWSTSLDDGRQEARQRLVSGTVTAALAEMVRSSPKYPVLVNEGILAMTLIASEREKGGAHLVALALLSDPAKRELDERAGESETLPEATERRGSAGAGAPPSASSGALNQPERQRPSRKATMDSLASQSSQPLPPPRTSADMIANVLARRDARMPPQFASNACVFVQTLIDGSNPDSASQNTAIRTVLQSWSVALGRLSEVGPQETITLAKQSFKNTTEFLTRA